MLPGPPSLRLRHLIFPSLRFTPFPPPPHHLLETVPCTHAYLVLSARSGSLRSRRLVPWGWGRWLLCVGGRAGEKASA